MKRCGKAIKVVIVLLLALLPAACSLNTAASKQVEKRSTEAIDTSKEYDSLFSQLKFNECRQLLESKYESIKSDVKLLNSYAYLEYHIYRDFAKAERLAKQAISLDRNNTGSCAQLGDVYKAWGKHSKAIKYYNKAVDCNTTYKEGHFSTELAKAYENIGDCYLYMGNAGKAEVYYEKAITYNPYNIETNYTLHRLYVLGEKYEKAYELWKKDNYIQGNKESPYGTINEWNMKYEKVLGDSQENKHLTMANLYYDLRLYDEAKAEYEKTGLNNPANKEIENKVKEIKILLSFREDIKSFFEEYYCKRCINGTKEQVGIYSKLTPIYEKVSVLFPDIQKLGAQKGG